jgi:hypothetical protein
MTIRHGHSSFYWMQYAGAPAAVGFVDTYRDVRAVLAE